MWSIGKNGCGVSGYLESICSSSFLRNLSFVVGTGLFVALLGFVSHTRSGFGGFKKVKYRQTYEPCTDALLRTNSPNITLPDKYESISSIYCSYNQTPGLDHWGVYGPAYDENIYHLREMALIEGRKVNMLEIGVQSGGSTRVWKKYFRGLTQYLGLDIDPRCRMFQSLEEGVRIITGSQLDTQLLSKICTQYGPFDLIVDDGGHTNKMIQTSLKSLWNCMKDRGVYVIEDLHTMNMAGYIDRRNEISVFEEIAEWMRIRSPNTHDQSQIELKNHPSWHVKKLSYYDSIMFLHYGQQVPALFQTRIRKGSLWNRFPIKEPKEELSLSDWCDDCCIGCFDD